MDTAKLTGSASERLRLDALDRYHILDTEAETQFDDIATLISDICDTPMAVITLVDEKRQWFKSRIGLDVRETPREIAFCHHTIQQQELFQVTDAWTDRRFADNPLVTGAPYIRFYAGVPLVTRDGFAVGALAVIDRVARTLSQRQQRALRILGREVVAQMELRKTVVGLEKAVRERALSEERLRSSHSMLEQRVSERTAALNLANETLQSEYEERKRDASVSQAIIDSLPGIFYVFDTAGRFLRWNRNFESITGYGAEEIAEIQVRDLFGSSADQEAVERAMQIALADGKSNVEAELTTHGGARIPYYFTGEKITLHGRDAVAGMGIDITERRRSEESLRLRNRAIEASVNAIVITDLAGNIEYANPAFERITGFSCAEVLGRNCRFLQNNDRFQPGLEALRYAVAAREEVSALMRNYRKDGELFWNDMHIAPVRDPGGTVTHFVGVLNDITEIKRYEQELERQANFDPLTALANRNVLKDRIRQAVASAERQGQRVAVGFIDLDNFKFINDSLGHSVGDELLKCVADRLAACLRGEDTIARYGGDEFAFVLVGQKDEKSIAALMDRILKAVDRPFQVDGHTLFVSCSIGLSFFPEDGQDVDTLLKNADAAMYRAKERGRNNFQLYTAAMNHRVTQRLSTESRLRQALERDEFVLHYQPKVNLRTGDIVGTEALLRWNLPGVGLVPPSSFIPLAEETGLIVAIGEWVLHRACADHRELHEAGLPGNHVAVNISSRQFEAQGLVDMVKNALLATGIDPHCLELELTESLVMKNPEEIIKVLREFRDMGLRLAIDDFGTGYSSLGYLQRFPVDRLKIDQSFVRDIGDDPNDAIIARAVISLGHSLGMSVIAEGVSNPEQLRFLRLNGCDEMQGYLFSRPLPLDELTLLLREKRSLPLQ